SPVARSDSFARRTTDVGRHLPFGRPEAIGNWARQFCPKGSGPAPGRERRMGRALRQKRLWEWCELWQAVGLRPRRPNVGALALLLLTSIGLQLLNPQVMRRFVDSAMRGAPDRDLALAAGVFLLIALIQHASSVGTTYLSETIGWAATNGLRAELLRHCLA